MDKENDSRKSGSHRSRDERGRTRSVGRYYHHSLGNYTMREHSSSSSFLVRKHKKRSRVDELQGEMKKINLVTFDGEHKKDEDEETWVLGMRNHFQLNNYSSHVEGRTLIYQLKGKESMWWDKLVHVQHIKETKCYLEGIQEVF